MHARSILRIRTSSSIDPLQCMERHASFIFVFLINVLIDFSERFSDQFSEQFSDQFSEQTIDIHADVMHCATAHNL